MNAVHERTNVMFPPDILRELRALVPARERSAFIAEATRKQLLVLKQRAALSRSAGVWSDEQHKDLTTEDDFFRYRQERNETWERPQRAIAEQGVEYRVPSGQ